eukprot:8901918-Pyramimonas_sp.AAC.1
MKHWPGCSPGRVGGWILKRFSLHPPLLTDFRGPHPAQTPQPPPRRAGVGGGGAAATTTTTRFLLFACPWWLMYTAPSQAVAGAGTGAVAS